VFERVTRQAPSAIEAALLKVRINPDSVLQVHKIEANLDKKLVDKHGNALPPCIVMERGEPLDVWAARSKPDRTQAFSVRASLFSSPCCSAFLVLIALSVHVACFLFCLLQAFHVQCFMPPVTCAATQNVVSGVRTGPRSSRSGRRISEFTRNLWFVIHTHTMRLKGASLDHCLPCFHALC
jgi:hypothetical protein